MHTLRSFQESFKTALMEDGAPAALTEQIVAGALTAERRINVYRNNMRSSLSESLRATYPAIHALVGDDFFRMLTQRYLQSFPSTSGDLHAYGDSFSTFLDDIAEVQTLPYLVDVARLEWCCHIVFHAAEAAPIAPDALSGLDEHQFAGIRLRLHPASAPVSSIYPLVDIWKLAIHGGEESDNVDIDSGGQRLLVARRNMEIEFQQLDTAEYAFVTKMVENAALEDCVEAAIEINPEFDVAKCLSKQFVLGNLVGFTSGPG